MPDSGAVRYRRDRVTQGIVPPQLASDKSDGGMVIVDSYGDKGSEGLFDKMSASLYLHRLDPLVGEES